MPVKLSVIPDPEASPEKPSLRYWLKCLAGLMVVCCLLFYFSGQRINSPGFWLFAVAVPLLFWLVAAWIRGIIYLLAHIRVNVWNRSREALILEELRRGRRALQVLQAPFITAHSRMEDAFGIPDLKPFIKNEHVLGTQINWNGERMRHSRLPVLPDSSVEDFLSQVFTSLLSALAISLSHYPDNQPVTLLLDAETSLSPQQVHVLWRNAWQHSGIRQSPEEIDDSGLAAIDRWLDRRTSENSLLLVVALLVAPENPVDTGEAVVALLLGNRMTQKKLMPHALLHRPEQGEAQTLIESSTQALDWGLVQPDELHHLWRGGLSPEQQMRVAALNGQPPLKGIEMNHGMYDLDSTLGTAGCAAPWLAIAAASQAAAQGQSAHLVISGEQNNAVVWATVVSPCPPKKEIS